MFRLSSRSPIGLDIGSRRVKAVQLAGSGAKARVVAAACIDRLTPGAVLTPQEAERISGTLRRRGFSGQSVVAAVPLDRLVSGTLELPPKASGAPLEQIARQELARAGKCDPGRMEFGWWELPGAGRPGEGTHALAMGCRHEDSEPFLEALESGGLECLALDAAPVALARALAPCVGAPPELTVVVEIGFSAVQVMILHGRPSTLVYERLMRELGVRAVQKRMEEQLGGDGELSEYLLRSVGCEQGVDAPGLEQQQEARGIVAQHAELVANELRVSVSYAQRRFGGQVAKVLLTGGGADIPGFADRVMTRLEMEGRCVRADTLAAWNSDFGDAAGPAGLVAMGLALHSDNERGGAAR